MNPIPHESISQPWCSDCGKDMHPQQTGMWIGIEYVKPAGHDRTACADINGKHAWVCPTCFFKEDWEQDWRESLIEVRPPKLIIC